MAVYTGSANAHAGPQAAPRGCPPHGHSGVPRPASSGVGGICLAPGAPSWPPLRPPGGASGLWGAGAGGSGSSAAPARPPPIPAARSCCPRRCPTSGPSTLSSPPPHLFSPPRFCLHSAPAPSASEGPIPTRDHPSLSLSSPLSSSCCVSPDLGGSFPLSVLQGPQL